ncbi:10599_t:CDS:1, partial [Acaulospora morrowiae]
DGTHRHELSLPTTKEIETAKIPKSRGFPRLSQNGWGYRQIAEFQKIIGQSIVG